MDFPYCMQTEDAERVSWMSPWFSVLEDLKKYRETSMQLVEMVVSDYPWDPWDCIFTYIHHNQPKVGKYTNPMNPVDYSIFGLFNKIISLSLSFSFFCIPFFSSFLGYSLPKKHQSYTTRPPISLTLKNPEYQRMQTKHYKQH